MQIFCVTVLFQLLNFSKTHNLELDDKSSKDSQLERLFINY